MKKVLKLVIAQVALFALVVSAAARANAADIVDIAAGNKDFSTLVALVKEAGLVDTLKGDGPFTVFAPTNAAFEKLTKKLGKAKVDAIVKDKKMLTAILTYHVVAGKVLAADAMKLNGKSAATVNGAKIKISAGKKGVKINNAKVIKADIEASNGVIHVIDTVLIPPTHKPAGKM